MTTVAPRLPPLMDVADFIGWTGDGLGTRYELIDGVLRAMAPGSDARNTIVLNIGRLVGNHLAKHRPGCRAVVAPGVQPRMRAEWNFRIPDIGVTCTPNQPGEIVTPDPVLLVEVLSPGNANDTYEAVRAYATLPSVQDILIVHSTKVRAELLSRGPDGSWPPDASVIEPGDAIALRSIGSELSLQDIYAGTHLA